MKAAALEILAPAGGPESLTAAVACGADAVYLGGAGLFNARRGAENFDEAALSQAVSYCHGRGVKVYLTVNTLVREEERQGLLPFLERVAALGADAVLVQDLAVARTLRCACPGLPLHASTQMSVTGADGALMLEELGFSRVVLGRELNLAEIASIRQRTAIELEVFVHGALCMSVSGQCTLSSMIGGRSGNRGLCAQPCRLPFSCGGSSHALSLRDLSLLDRLEELAAAGICSVKIEGRMKRPEYVAAAVTAAVEAREGKAPDLHRLAAVFSRSGFTQGYLDGRRDAAMFGVRQKEDVAAATDKLLGEYRRLYQKEARRVRAASVFTLKAEQPSILQVMDEDGFGAVAAGPAPQTARTAPTDREKAGAALSKTGGTPFRMEDAVCDIDPGLMLPASALNDLRRRALASLLEQREIIRPHPWSREAAASAWWVTGERKIPATPALRVRLGRADQLEAAAASGAELIALPLHLWQEAADGLIAANLHRLAVELPRCTYGADDILPPKLKQIAALGVRQAVAGSLGAIRQGREAGLGVHGDTSLNITNTAALEEYRQLGLLSASLSFELTLREALSLGGSLPRGLPAYGYLPLMALRNCPVRAHNRGCKGSRCDWPHLTDRLGKQFFLDCDGATAFLHNCVPLWMADRSAELGGLDFVTLYFTREDPAETARVLEAYSGGASPVGEHTRGLYYRRENAGKPGRK